MRRTPLLALVVLAAACSDGPLQTPSIPEESDASDEALYRAIVEEALQNPAPVTVSPNLTDQARPALAPPPSGATEVVVNGSFETGFSGWTATTPAGFVIWPWDVAEDGVGTGAIFESIEPTYTPDGDSVAWHGWDAGTPGDFELSQVIYIPSGSATLSWQERLQWIFFSGSQARTHDVELRSPDDDVLVNLRTFSTGNPDDNPTGDTGWQPFTVDVSAFAGSTVKLVFTQHVPEAGPGPGQVEIDHVHLLVGGAIPVEVDIKPGSDTNPVSTRSRGTLPVAILTTDDFDAADVDAATVTLGDDDGDDTSVAERGRSGKLHAALEDVDDDGDLDLMLHFSIRELTANGDLTSSTTELFVSGATVGGGAIAGSDDVRVVR